MKCLSFLQHRWGPEHSASLLLYPQVEYLELLKGERNGKNEFKLRMRDQGGCFERDSLPACVRAVGKLPLREEHLATS